MNELKIYINVMKTLATIALAIIFYLFVPFHTLGGLFAGLILYGIWCPFFSPYVGDGK